MSTVLEQVIGAGLKLSVEGDRLRVRGPQRLLDHSPLMEEIRKHKNEILAQLKGDFYQEWQFEIVIVGTDRWVVGTRLDQVNPSWTFWAIRGEQGVRKQ